MSRIKGDVLPWVAWALITILLFGGTVYSFFRGWTFLGYIGIFAAAVYIYAIFIAIRLAAKFIASITLGSYVEDVNANKIYTQNCF